MDKKEIDCVVIHKGYQPYLKYNLEITSKNNNVYLIGDKSLKFLEKIRKNITFIDIKKYEEDAKLNFYKNNFINYSTNSFDFEWFCFARVFIINNFLNEFNLNQIFHIDSDNILLTNINNLHFTNENAFMIPYNQESQRMSASIHSGLISQSFCDEFSVLFEDLYINKKKFDLIEEKIAHHKKYNLPGGICDMTLYYILHKENLLSPQNLFEPLSTLNNEEMLFINHLKSAEGPYGKENFELKDGKLKIYKGNSVADIIKNKKIKICNIHYQGGSKQFVNRFTKYKLSY